MQQVIAAEIRTQAPASEQAGCYVYCVAPAIEATGLGPTGIEGREVRAVAHNGLCALVHHCPAQPYQSDDAEVTASWVLAHHRVVETAWRRCGTVLPITFNTIIRAEEGSAEESLRAWLNRECPRLEERLRSLAGKAEYGVQLFWNIAVIGKKVAQGSPQLRALEEEIRSKSRGLAYMYRQRLERLLRSEMEARAEEESRDLYARLDRCVESIHIERAKRDQNERQMLMDLSCLVSAERYPELEAELKKVGQREGLYVRLTGPLPPYSFC
ncbi:MAG: GvpL/GvpF family gas vesicle protein [Chloroflexi bacterium]|nr:GvpL/GvpF family gas vesicle protein [Chloroflexota bacterium]